MSINIQLEEKLSHELMEVGKNIQEGENNYSLILNEDADLRRLKSPNTNKKMIPAESILGNNRAILLRRICCLIILPIILIIFSSYLYILTLEPCIGDEHYCVDYLTKKLNFFLNCGLFSGLIFAILINLSIFKIIHRIFVIIIIADLIFLCYVYDTGNSFRSHGGWNRSVYLPTFILLTLVILALVPLAKMIKKHPIILPSIIVIIIFIIAVYIHHRVKYSCQGWENGLKGVAMNTTEPYCQLIVPEICYFAVTGRLFDLTYILHMTCEGGKSEDIYDFIPKNAKRIGYPRTEYFTDAERFDYINERGAFQFQRLVLNRLIDLDDEKVSKETKEKTEIRINVEDRKNPKVIIDLRRNETVVERAENNIKKRRFQPLAKNVIILFIDSISRAHMYRTMPNLVNWLEDRYENTNSSIKTESFQFFRFHSTHSYTVVNLKPLYYGIEEDKEFDDPVYPQHIRNDYKEQGYVLGGSFDLCVGEFYEYGGNDDSLNIGRKDHEGQSLFCDPSFTDPNSYYATFKGENSIVRRCLYGKDASQYTFQYANQFWEKYKDLPKYLELNFVDAHEATGHGSRYLDIYITQFLQGLGEYEETAILLLSDHGIRLSRLYYPDTNNTDQHREELLPLLFLILPKNMTTQEQRNALKHNENSLIYNFDLHETLQEIGGTNKESIARNKYNYTTYSLFEHIPPNRTGKDVNQQLSACRQDL